MSWCFSVFKEKWVTAMSPSVQQILNCDLCSLKAAKYPLPVRLSRDGLMETTLSKLPNQLNSPSSEQKRKEYPTPGTGGGGVCVWRGSLFSYSVFLPPAPQEVLPETRICESWTIGCTEMFLPRPQAQDVSPTAWIPTFCSVFKRP